MIRRRLHAIILILLVSKSLFSQGDIKNLVFEGAGIRGLAYAGALEVLEDNSTIEGVENVGGTSAGAITAMMISLGYRAHEVDSIISSTDFGKFNEGEYLFVGGIARMKKNFGWYKTDKFETWLARIIESKTQNKEITFGELEKNGFKNLYITATCLNKQKLLIFSKDSYPQMRIKDAVKISMSVPIYFEAVWIDSLGSIQTKTDTMLDYDLVMDGGVLGNFPIDIFDSDSEDTTGQIIRIPNPKTLGFRIDSEDQIKYDEENQGLSPREISTVQDYMLAMYILVIENLNRRQLEDFDWERTISISDVGIGPKVKSLTAEQKQQLKASGRKSTLEFFSAKN